MSAQTPRDLYPGLDAALAIMSGDMQARAARKVSDAVLDSADGWPPMVTSGPYAGKRVDPKILQADAHALQLQYRDDSQRKGWPS